MNPPTLVLRGTEERWELVLDVKAVAASIGEDVLAHFYRCFVAVDRIVSLESLLVLNMTELDHDSVACERNLHHLVLLLAAAMYEAGDALQGLTAGPFGRKLQTMATWAPLNQMRAEWNKEPFASKIRNGFAHHFGEIETYRAGILQGPASAVIEVGEGERRINGRVIEPWDALLRGERVQNKQMSDFVKKSQDAHTKLPELLASLFHEVLTDAGVVMRNDVS
jgi:hypothetical protein